MALDTSPEAQELQRTLWRGMGPQGRVRLAAEMSEEARNIALAGIAYRQPGLTEAERTRELVRLMHGLDIPVFPSRG